MPRNQKEIILILQLIRDHGPIDSHELYALITGKSDTTIRSMAITNSIMNLLMPLGTSKPPGHIFIRHFITKITDELVSMGLVTKSRFINPQYKISKQYDHIIQLFGISLSSYTSSEKSGQTILSNPVWGSPEKVNIDLFVIMPFRKELQSIFDKHIKIIANNMGLSCIRGDDSFSTKSIMDEVWSSIYHANLCIVDCTGRNPNVFYELGIAHTLGRKTILIAQSVDDIPFDIQHMRVIIYDISIEGLQEFDKTLKKNS